MEDSTGLPISLAKCTATGTNHAREEPEHFQNDLDVAGKRKNCFSIHAFATYCPVFRDVLRVASCGHVSHCRKDNSISTWCKFCCWSPTVQKKRIWRQEHPFCPTANLLRQAISRGRTIFTTQKLDHVPGESDSDSDKSLCRWNLQPQSGRITLFNHQINLYQIKTRRFTLN